MSDDDIGAEMALANGDHISGDEKQPRSEEKDTPTPPAANPSLDMDNDKNYGEDESDLSDIDEDQFVDFDPTNIAIQDRPAIAVDESNVGLIGVHKRKRADADGEDGGAKKKRERKRDKPKKTRKTKDDDDDFSGGEEITGKRQRKSKPTGERRERATITRARKPSPVNEEELSPEERKSRPLRRVDT